MAPREYLDFFLVENTLTNCMSMYANNDAEENNTVIENVIFSFKTSLIVVNVLLLMLMFK